MLKIRCVGSKLFASDIPRLVPIPTGELNHYKGDLMCPTIELHGSIPEVLKATRELRDFHRSEGRTQSCAFETGGTQILCLDPCAPELRLQLRLYLTTNQNEAVLPEIDERLRRDLRESLHAWKQGLFLKHRVTCELGGHRMPIFDKDPISEVEVPYPTGEVMHFGNAWFEAPLLKICGRMPDVISALNILRDAEAKEGWRVCVQLVQLAMELDHPGHVTFLGCLWRESGGTTPPRVTVDIVDDLLIAVGLKAEELLK